jgi:putative transposase
MLARPAEWRWSSYRATAGLIRRPPWLETQTILGRFHPCDARAAAHMYREFIAETIEGQTRTPHSFIRSESRA